MVCRERARLWSYDASELAVEARVEVDAHLELCDDCREALEGVRASRQLLRAAVDERPEVDWKRVDDGVRQAAAVELQKLRRRPFFEWQTGLALAVAACAVFVLVNRPGTATQQPIEVPVAVAANAPERPQVTAWAERSVQASVRTAAGAEPLALGAGLAAGSTVETPEGGELKLKLVDESRVRIEPQSSLALHTLAEKNVALRLERGAVNVEASHRPREAFVVSAGDLQIRVVGTAFRVAMVGERVEVEVTEGRVLVEPAAGEAQLIEAGSRYAWDRTAKQGAVGRLASLEPAEVARPEPQTTPSAPRAIAARPSAPVPLASPSAPSPTIVEPPAAVEQPAPVETVATVERTHPPERLPVSESVPRTVEEMFLRRAEEAIGKADCSRFLTGLEELVEHPGAAGSGEKARILRARCFDDRVMPVEADAEYRRYLRDFPSGRFAAEARGAVAH